MYLFAFLFFVLLAWAVNQEVQRRLHKRQTEYNYRDFKTGVRLHEGLRLMLLEYQITLSDSEFALYIGWFRYMNKKNYSAAAMSSTVRTGGNLLEIEDLPAALIKYRIAIN